MRRKIIWHASRNLKSIFDKERPRRPGEFEACSEAPQRFLGPSQPGGSDSIIAWAPCAGAQIHALLKLLVGPEKRGFAAAEQRCHDDTNQLARDFLGMALVALE